MSYAVTMEGRASCQCALVLCRHVRSIVSLALDALAARDLRHVKAASYNQRVIRAMRLRYGLDDDRPRTLKEVSSSLSLNIRPNYPAFTTNVLSDAV